MSLSILSQLLLNVSDWSEIRFGDASLSILSQLLPHTRTGRSPTVLTRLLSILSQLLPELSRTHHKRSDMSAFNSFPVAAGVGSELAGGEPFGCLSILSQLLPLACALLFVELAGLSILSQLLRAVTLGWGCRIAGISFQFFPSCCLRLYADELEKEVYPFNSFPVAAEGFISRLLISFSLFP